MRCKLLLFLLVLWGCAVAGQPPSATVVLGPFQTTNLRVELPAGVKMGWSERFFVGSIHVDVGELVYRFRDQEYQRFRVTSALAAPATEMVEGEATLEVGLPVERVRCDGAAKEETGGAGFEEAPPGVNLREVLLRPGATATLRLPSGVPGAAPLTCAVKVEQAGQEPLGEVVPAGPADAGAVGKWIDDLTGLDSFDTGLSPVYGGSDFPPVAGQLHWSVATLSERREHRRSEAVKNLVAAGADALPLLLEHLDDKRPTKLVVKHETSFGGMWHAAELRSPRPNAREQEAFKLKGVNEERDGLEDGIASHTVTVGDACFVIVGMIANRAYNAVRYQPTACIVINSPTSTPAIAAALRKMWGERPRREDLRAWLEEDFAHGEFGAATRLLFYFPEESKALVAKRLAALLAADDDEAADLVAAVSWCKDPAIRPRIRAAALKSRDGALVGAALPAFAAPGEEQGLRELEQLADRWRKREAHVLEKVLATAFGAHPSRAASLLERVLPGGGHDLRLACLGACAGLAEPPVKPLLPLLGDRSPGIGYYLVEGAGVRKDPEAGDFLAHRVCDNAWVLLCRALGDARAACVGDRAAMDGRIAALRKRLAGEEAGWRFSAAEIERQEQGRTARAREVQEREARLQELRDNPAEADLVALEDDGLTPDHWRAAAGRLFLPPGAEDPSMSHAVLNRRLQRDLVVDGLPEADRRRVRAALEKRSAKALDVAPDSWPSKDCAGYFVLAERACPAQASLLRWKILRRLESLAKRRGFPRESADLDAALAAADVLLESGAPGAAEWFARWCRAAKPEALDDGMGLREFVEVLVAHRDLPPLQTAAEAMFGGGKSAWNPLRLDYAPANSLADASALDLPAFRRALRAALDREDVVGELELSENDPDYCSISWHNNSGSGMGVGKDEPRGVKPGGPPMKLRRCDMLLEAVAHPVFARHDGPEFHIYWPLDRRNQGREEWRKWLAEER